MSATVLAKCRVYLPLANQPLCKMRHCKPTLGKKLIQNQKARSLRPGDCSLALRFYSHENIDNITLKLQYIFRSYLLSKAVIVLRNRAFCVAM